MPTTFVKGDLFEDLDKSAEGVVGAEPQDSKGEGVYGVAFAAETSGEMSRGLALAFKKRWPALAEAFRDRAGDKGLEPGEVFVWEAEGVVIFALGVLAGDKKAKLGALTRAVAAMVAEAQKRGLSRVALGRIVGFDPVRVKRVLTDAGAASVLDLMVFEQFVRAKPSK